MSRWPVLEMEACSLRAWPGAEESRLGGWPVRSTGGYTRRANSAHPLAEPECDLAAAVRRVRDWYRARHRRAIFKMTDAAVPAGLDAHLAAEGWSRVAPTRVMARPLTPADAVAPPLPAGFRLSLDDEPREDWLDAYCRWHDLPAESRRWHRSIVSGIRPDRAPARVLGPDAGVVAVGLAVADGPWVGLFDLATHPAHRSRGLGRSLVGALLAWGAERGARAAYLQVEDRNEAARRLYGHLAFADAYPYWYREAPETD